MVVVEVVYKIKIMKYLTHNEKEDIDPNGTSLIECIHVFYDTLVQVFGKPMKGHDKSDAEWEIEFEDGTVATIYNYKDGKNYLGKNGMKTKDITYWHIGGHNQKAWDYVKYAIDNKKREQKLERIVKDA